MLTGQDELTVAAVEAELAALEASQAEDIGLITLAHRELANLERLAVRRRCGGQRKKLQTLLAVLRGEADGVKGEK